MERPSPFHPHSPLVNGDLQAPMLNPCIGSQVQEKDVHCLEVTLRFDAEIKSSCDSDSVSMFTEDYLDHPKRKLTSDTSDVDETYSNDKPGYGLDSADDDDMSLTSFSSDSGDEYLGPRLKPFMVVKGKSTGTSLEIKAPSPEPKKEDGHGHNCSLPSWILSDPESPMHFADEKEFTEIPKPGLDPHVSEIRTLSPNSVIEEVEAEEEVEIQKHEEVSSVTDWQPGLLRYPLENVSSSPHPSPDEPMTPTLCSGTLIEHETLGDDSANDGASSESSSGTAPVTPRSNPTSIGIWTAKHAPLRTCPLCKQKEKIKIASMASSYLHLSSCRLRHKKARIRCTRCRKWNRPNTEHQVGSYLKHMFECESSSSDSRGDPWRTSLVLCSLCDDPSYKLLSYFEFMTHISQYHQGRFACTRCPRTFSTRSQEHWSSSTHKRFMDQVPMENWYTWLSEKPQLPDIPWFCPGCSKKFVSEIERDSQVASMHPNVERKWQCGECRKAYFHPDEFTMHKMLEHERETKTKPLSCGECGGIFVKSHLLKEHMILKHGHHDDRIKCDQCEKAFFVKSSLRSHKSCYHWKGKPVVV